MPPRKYYPEAHSYQAGSTELNCCHKPMAIKFNFVGITVHYHLLIRNYSMYTLSRVLVSPKP